MSWIVKEQSTNQPNNNSLPAMCKWHKLIISIGYPHRVQLDLLQFANNNNKKSLIWMQFTSCKFRCVFFFGSYILDYTTDQVWFHNEIRYTLKKFRENFYKKLPIGKKCSIRFTLILVSISGKGMQTVCFCLINWCKSFSKWWKTKLYMKTPVWM